MPCLNFSERSGVFRQDGSFLHEVHFGIEVCDRHPVLDVAVEAVGLLDQDDLAGRIRQEGDHLGEGLTTGTLGRLDVLEPADDLEPMVEGVLLQQFPLCRDGEAFLFLFLSKLVVTTRTTDSSRNRPTSA